MTLVWRTPQAGDSGSTTANSFNATLPVDAVVDDWAVVSIGQNGTQALTVTGWTLIAGPTTTTGNNNRITTYKKKLTSGDISAGSVACSFASSQRFTWTAVAVGGAEDVDVIATPQVGSSATTTCVVPTLDPTETSTFEVAFIVGRNPTSGATTTYDPTGSGFSEIADRCTSAGAAVNTSMWAGTKSLAADTATGTANVTASGSVTYCTHALNFLTADPQTVTLGTIAPSGGLGAPTVVPGAIAVTLGTIAPAGGFGDPTVTVAANTVTVDLGTLAPSGGLGAPTVVPGGIALALDTLAPSGGLGAPQVVVGGVILSLGTIPKGGSLGAPALSFGGIAVTLDSITPSGGLGSPAVVPGGIAIDLGSIVPSGGLGGPSITSILALALATLAPKRGLGSPTIIVSGRTTTRPIHEPPATRRAAGGPTHRRGYS